jgi:hypothetical protein
MVREEKVAKTMPDRAGIYFPAELRPGRDLCLQTMQWRVGKIFSGPSSWPPHPQEKGGGKNANPIDYR